MLAVRERARSLTPDSLSQSWDAVRKSVLWASGLRDLTDAQPGMGNTGHSFNDYNHVDCTCMAEQVQSNTNQGQVEGIHMVNQLGPGVKIASLPELGPGKDQLLTSQSGRLPSGLWRSLRVPS